MEGLLNWKKTDELKKLKAIVLHDGSHHSSCIIVFVEYILLYMFISISQVKLFKQWGDRWVVEKKLLIISVNILVIMTYIITIIITVIMEKQCIEIVGTCSVNNYLCKVLGQVSVCSALMIFF